MARAGVCSRPRTRPLSGGAADRIEDRSGAVAGADGAGIEVPGVRADVRHVAGVGAGAVQQRDVQEDGVACRDRDGNSVAMPEPGLGQSGLARRAASPSVLGLQFMRQVAEFVGAGGDVQAAVLHAGVGEGEPGGYRRRGLDASPRQVATPGCGTSLRW